MHLIFIFCGISVIFLMVNGSTINSKDVDSELGEPLYLTKYIENGDIETVIAFRHDTN